MVCEWVVAECNFFVLADRESDGQVEAQLSFWGEPFMARTTGHDVPRLYLPRTGAL